MSEQSSPTWSVEWDLADRLRKSLRLSGVGVQEMADHLEVNRNTVGTWINGHHAPSASALRLWSLRCGVPYGWLRDGSVPADRPDGPSTQAVPSSGCVTADDATVLPFPTRNRPVPERTAA